MAQATPIRKTAKIQGSYLGRAGEFSSGDDERSYDRTLKHLRTVLAAAEPEGDPFWGNKGVQITAWTFADGTLLKGFQLHTIADLDRTMSIVVNRPGYTPQPKTPTGRANWS
jgi:hypothetical protein